jgi:hypothetical protein
VSPLDFQALYRFLAAYLPIEAEKLLQNYCDPRLTGDLQIRCWRFLSAIADEKTLRLPPALYSRLGDRSGRAWQLFRKAFPSRAILLEKLSQ